SDSGRGDVEPERRVEFPVIQFGDGFLSSIPARPSFGSKLGIKFGIELGIKLRRQFRSKRCGATAAGATRDRRVGVRTVRAGIAGSPSRRTRRRSRVANRVDCVWGAARSV